MFDDYNLFKNVNNAVIVCITLPTNPKNPWAALPISDKIPDSVGFVDVVVVLAGVSDEVSVLDVVAGALVELTDSVETAGCEVVAALTVPVPTAANPIVDAATAAMIAFFKVFVFSNVIFFVNIIMFLVL